MKKRVVSLVVVLCMLFCNCSVWATPAQPMPDVFVQSVNNFSWKLYDELDNESDNIFYSPYSLVVALGMLDLMADGNTKTELESVLGTSDIDGFVENMQEVASKYDEKIFSSANALCMREGFDFAEDSDESVIKPLKDYFGAEIFEIDFNKVDEAKEQIREWVAKYTKDMIPDYESSVSDETICDLLNAVAFQDDWEEPFEEINTYEEPFYGLSFQDDVDMMHAYEMHCRYLDDFVGVNALALNYANGAEMDILLPVHKDEFIGDVLANIDVNLLLETLDESMYVDIETLALPKFSMDITMDSDVMISALKSMGMLEAFTLNADFRKLSYDMFVSNIVHRAFVDVDENGTKAAAVTEITLDAKGAFFPESEIINFIVDRPFVFVIRDYDSGTILFTGQVNDIV